MKSEVYFLRVTKADGLDERVKKFSLFLDRLDAKGVFGFIRRGESLPIKMHFGEEGNTGYVEPPYIRILADRIASKGVRPVIADSNVLYRGQRTFTHDHLALARRHGFTQEAAGADVVIAGGDIDADAVEVAVDGYFIKSAKIASFFSAADGIVSAAHFKGHLLTGFGGALKNIGMGCASRVGKLAQHSDLSPQVMTDSCVGCGTCVEVCPAEAIALEDEKARIDGERCIGCAECIASCSYGAITVDWESGHADVQEKMVEYAAAVLSGKLAKSIFVNFAMKISQECDCFPKDFPVIAPDVGIFVSRDPVAVDSASMDAVIASCGRDVFKEAHPKRDGRKQLRHAEKMGLGSAEHTLIDLS